MYKATGELVRNRTFTQNPRKKLGYQGIARLLTNSGAATAGTLIFRNLHFPAALGKGGVRALKREGDGTTPFGVWPLVQVYYRADRVRRPSTALPVERLTEAHGWCDGPGDRNYNRKVIVPYKASAERLWRDDRLYDVIAVLDYNMRPRSAKTGKRDLSSYRASMLHADRGMHRHAARASAPLLAGCGARRGDSRGTAPPEDQCGRLGFK